MDRRLSSTLDRMPSTRSSRSVSPDTSEDEDEYDLAAAGVSDGFRPSTASMGHNRISSRTDSEPPIRRSTPPPRPSSATKPRNIDSFALRHDGANTSSPGHVSTAASASGMGAITRSSSVSTDVPFMRPESPYRGPSAPSHPYQMYPQNARLARTLSVATASTYQTPSERQYAGPNGPAHPYGMYPQNTVVESESPSDEITAIPVGFPGHQNQYHRRLGPDGEDAADIIGPDGHTEQLPPYTQYPDEAFARKTGVPTALPGAGGIGLATRNPEFSSTEDIPSPSALSSRSVESNNSSPPLHVEVPVVSEKSEEKGWKAIARRKVWGIVPIWAFVLVGIVLVLFAIILGTAFAVVKSKMDHGPHPAPSSTTSAVATSTRGTVTVTTTFDATPLTSYPTSLPSLPTGTFGLDIGTPSTSEQSCIADSTKYNAWSCQIPPNMLRLSISRIAGANDTSDQLMTIYDGNDTSTTPEYYYGTQPPVLSANQTMELVNDTDSSLYGPSWFSEVPYDKLVIAYENSLSISSSSSSSSSKRSGSLIDFPFTRRGLAQAGDKPWFCYWNSTLMETFIYPNVTVGGSSTPTASSTGAAASATSNTPSEASGADYMSQFYSFYPQVIRMEERRIPSNNAVQPYCIQMQILNNGQASPVTNSTGDMQIIYIVEDESTSSEQTKRNLSKLSERDDGSDTSCRCVWVAS